MVREIKQINPIDFESRVAVGVALPFNQKGVFESTYTTKEQSKSNLINLLLTSPGEKLFNSSFGVGLRNLLFEQEIDREELIDRINSQVEIYLPYINVNNIQFAQNEHTVNIQIVYSILPSNEIDSILLNFDGQTPDLI